MIPHASESALQQMTRLAWNRVHELEQRLVLMGDRKTYERRIAELEATVERLNRRRSA